MTASVYCFVSGGSVHCLPVGAFTEESPKLDNYVSKDALNLKNKGLLYTLNNPLLTELDQSKLHSYSFNESSSEDDDSLNNDNDVLDKEVSDNSISNHVSASEIEATQEFSHGGKSQDIKTKVVHDDKNYSNVDDDANISAILDNYCTHSLYLPDYTVNLPDNLNGNYCQIKLLLAKVFSKTWLNKDDIEISQLTGGITNMLLKCHYKPTGTIVLMRVYGSGTNLIIDRHREFILHLLLNSMDLAPPVYARFNNGLIYGFLEGRSLEPSELKHENLYPLIAQQLGNWHSKVGISSVKNGVTKLRQYADQDPKKDLGKLVNGNENSSGVNKKQKVEGRLIADIWELIEYWIDVVPISDGLIQSFQENSNSKQSFDKSNIKSAVLSEFKWLKQTLTSHIHSPSVSSHCDLLSGNIIIPNDDLINKEITQLPDVNENPIKFIDYEYMLPAPRAFDIANHLAEWQGFECDRLAIPSPVKENPTVIRWVKSYVNDFNSSSEKVESLIDEIACYFGMPGFYWGIWAMIQSEISNIDFDYSNYGKMRLQEYWDWKINFTTNIN